MRRNLVQCSLLYDTTISNIYALNDTFNGSGNTGSFTGTAGTTLANPSGNELEVSSTTVYPVISSTISTTTGKEYTVSADLNGMTSSPGYTASVLCEVIESGVTVASQSTTAPGSFNFTYTAGAGSASVRYTFVLTPNPGPPPPPPMAPFSFNLDNALVYFIDTAISSETVCVSKNGYRYGFNRMEKVDEVSGEGNGYDFGARMYDGRLGRWFSVDPLTFEFPEVAPYVYCNNVPLYYIDYDGQKPKVFGRILDRSKPHIKYEYRKVEVNGVIQYQRRAHYYNVNYEPSESQTKWEDITSTTYHKGLKWRYIPEGPFKKAQKINHSTNGKSGKGNFITDKEFTTSGICFINVTLKYTTYREADNISIQYLDPKTGEWNNLFVTGMVSTGYDENVETSTSKVLDGISSFKIKLEAETTESVWDFDIEITVTKTSDGGKYSDPWDDNWNNDFEFDALIIPVTKVEGEKGNKTKVEKKSEGVESHQSYESSEE